MIFSKHELQYSAPYRFTLRRNVIASGEVWPRALVSKELLGNSTDFKPTDRYGDDWREYEQEGSALIIRLIHDDHGPVEMADALEVPDAEPRAHAAVS